MTFFYCKFKVFCICILAVYLKLFSERRDEGVKSFAQFTNSLWATEQSDEDTPALEQMAVRAVDVLDDTEEGFFLMIEGAHIDKHSHDNNVEDMVEALIEFDKTVEAMLEYAKENGEVTDNCQLPVRIAAVLGFEESQFPISVNS